MRVMYRVCGLRLGPNFVLWLAADKNFYLWLTVEKMHAFAVFTDKYLRPYGFSDTIFTATVNCTNPKSEILSKIIEIQIIGVPINFLFRLVETRGDAAPPPPQIFAKVDLLPISFFLFFLIYLYLEICKFVFKRK